ASPWKVRPHMSDWRLCKILLRLKFNDGLPVSRELITETLLESLHDLMIQGIASITPRLRRLVMKFRLLPRQPRQALPGGFNQKLFHRSQQHRNVHRFLQERTHARVDRREELIRARSDDDDGDERMLAGELLKGVPAILDGH